jgi:hypothetical protein
MVPLPFQGSLPLVKGKKQAKIFIRLLDEKGTTYSSRQNTAL